MKVLSAFNMQHISIWGLKLQEGNVCTHCLRRSAPWRGERWALRPPALCTPALGYDMSRTCAARSVWLWMLNSWGCPCTETNTQSHLTCQICTSFYIIISRSHIFRLPTEETFSTLFTWCGRTLPWNLHNYAPYFVPITETSVDNYSAH